MRRPPLLLPPSVVLASLLFSLAVQPISAAHAPRQLRPPPRARAHQPLNCGMQPRRPKRHLPCKSILRRCPCVSSSTMITRKTFNGSLREYLHARGRRRHLFAR